MMTGVSKDRQAVGHWEGTENLANWHPFKKFFLKDRKRKGNIPTQHFCDFGEFPYQRFSSSYFLEV